MDLTQKLKDKLSEYGTREFHIDEHALKRCRDYHNLDLDEVLSRLKSRKFETVVKNDSKQAELEHYDSYKARLPKSNQYQYEVVLYLTEDKSLIKTVSKLDKRKQEMIDDARGI